IAPAFLRQSAHKCAQAWRRAADIACMQRAALLRTLMCAAVCACVGPLVGLAQQRKATPTEAVALVQKAVAAIKRDGAPKTYAEIRDRRGPFALRDLYVAVFALD